MRWNEVEKKKIVRRNFGSRRNTQGFFLTCPRLIRENPDGTLIYASSVPHCEARKRRWSLNS